MRRCAIKFIETDAEETAHRPGVSPEFIIRQNEHREKRGSGGRRRGKKMALGTYPMTQQDSEGSLVEVRTSWRLRRDEAYRDAPITRRAEMPRPTRLAKRERQGSGGEADHSGRFAVLWFYGLFSTRKKSPQPSWGRSPARRLSPDDHVWISDDLGLAGIGAELGHDRHQASRRTCRRTLGSPRRRTRGGLSRRRTRSGRSATRRGARAGRLQAT